MHLLLGGESCSLRGLFIGVLGDFFCSDFPFVASECGYTNAWQIIPSGNSTRICSEEDLEALMGGTALSVWRGGWRETEKNDLDDDIMT